MQLYNTSDKVNFYLLSSEKMIFEMKMGNIFLEIISFSNEKNAGSVKIRENCFKNFFYNNFALNIFNFIKASKKNSGLRRQK